MKVAFLGLGNMGLPMAKQLVAAGHDVTVWNRSPKMVEGARAEASPAEAARGAEVVVTMLADDRAVEEVVAAAQLSREQIHVSCSTISVALARRMATSQSLVCAPVFGRPEAAAAKKLWVVAAGAHIERVRPVLEAMGQGVLVAGEEPAAANVVKLAGNFFIASQVEALGEMFGMAERAGVPREQLLSIFKASLFRAPIAEGYAGIIAGKRYQPAGFAAPLGRKDIGLMLELARLPLAELMHQHLGALPADLDWAAMGDATIDNPR
jgi:3-hydroxyisobutyrate dehydrogenase-like beta-hydroxyacid dehydrogenase